MTSVLAFFLSPGRSGTQWMAAVLDQVYSDIADIEHEPIHYEYRPRSTLRAQSFANFIEDLGAVRQHLSHIEQLLQSGGSYIDTGWSVFSWIPYFIDKYQPIVRLIHVTRHPVYFALSMETHGFYDTKLRNDGYTQHAQLEPTDPGVLHKEYIHRWGTLSRFEKCLFQWLEIHSYALELHQRNPGIPFLRVRMEDLVASDDAWTQMTDFLGLPRREAEIQKLRGERVDKFHWKLETVSDPALIYEHSAVLELTAKLGYDPGGFDRARISNRYERPWQYRALVRIGKSVIPRRYYRPVGQMARRLLEF